MNKRDVMKADGSSHCLFDLPCPSKVHEPPPWKPSTFINVLWRELNLCEKIGIKQTEAVCAVTGNLSRTLTVPCPTRHGLCHHVTPLTLSRHTHRWWPDLIMCHTRDFLGGGCGSWGGLVLLVKVSRRSATPGPDGKCLVWGGGWLLNLASFGMFVQQTLTYYANNNWESKIWRKGDYCELNCFILL